MGESGMLYQLETPFDEGYRSLTQDELEHEGLTLIIAIPYRVVAVVEVRLQFVVLQMLIKAGRLDSAIPFLFPFLFFFFSLSLSFIIRGVLAIRSLSEASCEQFVGHFKLATCEGQEDDVLVDEEQSSADELATQFLNPVAMPIETRLQDVIHFLLADSTSPSSD